MFYLKGGKAEIGREVSYIGHLGTFENAENEMAVEIALKPVKVNIRCKRIELILELGAITMTEPEGADGGLSFSDPSIFGRFGRPLRAPLYAKLNPPFYHIAISDRAVRAYRRRSESLRAMAPRKIRPRSATQIGFRNLHGRGDRGRNNFGRRSPKTRPLEIAGGDFDGSGIDGKRTLAGPRR